MNQNLEGSLFSTLRKEPFDKVVRDARQSGLGWVVFFRLALHIYDIHQCRSKGSLSQSCRGEGLLASGYSVAPAVVTKGRREGQELAGQDHRAL